MAWTKLDDRFWSHPKIQGLSPQAFRLYVMGLNWSVSHLTDGRVPPGAIAMFVTRSRRRTVDELVTVGLWKEASDGAYLIHDFDVYQPTKAQVEKERSQTRQRSQAYRDRRKESSSRSASRVTDTVTDTVTNATPTRPDPVESPSDSRARTPDLIWEALVAVVFDDPAEVPRLTKSERGRLNAARKELREIGVEDPAEVRRRGDAYRRLWPEIELTANALVANWSRFDDDLDVGACRHRWPSGKTAISEITRGDDLVRRCDICYQEEDE